MLLFNPRTILQQKKIIVSLQREYLIIAFVANHLVHLVSYPISKGAKREIPKMLCAGVLVSNSKLQIAPDLVLARVIYGARGTKGVFCHVWAFS